MSFYRKQADLNPLVGKNSLESWVGVGAKNKNKGLPRPLTNFDPSKNLGRWVEQMGNNLLLADEKTQAQRGEATCPKTHSKSASETWLHFSF